MKIHRFRSVTSTNDILKQMAEEGAPEWTVVIAGEQTKGRGRKDRTWYSPPGNLYLSVLMRPDISPNLLTRMPALVSYALFEAIGVEIVELSLKWPNDILLRGRKVAGVLVEARSKGEKVLYIAAGMGINIRLDPAVVPSELKESAAALDEIEGDWSVDSLTERIVDSLKKNGLSFAGQKWDHLRTRWASRADWKNPVVVRNGPEEISGRPKSIAEDGSLMLLTADGTVRIHAGDLLYGFDEAKR